ncbi:hypothetical protein BU26DRAFT_507660 [Trematosphaeria pertusa]|uniref:Uncharacterized protein n=1 Tax=Trematosphaeria pertusa TaxID=390896 RepID=A0A6A6I903_9PLEO|nr:uncharacterized protein BU26DRAFT_507660 [Trematosphaeria pertusa]KAF2246000.1 hypothetical protein BU26DRAFT_507660 [Trematosphaeria pertusa]
MAPSDSRRGSGSPEHAFPTRTENTSSDYSSPSYTNYRNSQGYVPMAAYSRMRPHPAHTPYPGVRRASQPIDIPGAGGFTPATPRLQPVYGGASPVDAPQLTSHRAGSNNPSTPLVQVPPRANVASRPPSGDHGDMFSMDPHPDEGVGGKHHMPTFGGRPAPGAFAIYDPVTGESNDAGPFRQRGPVYRDGTPIFPRDHYMVPKSDHRGEGPQGQAGAHARVTDGRQCCGGKDNRKGWRGPSTY